jgi:hypothetical protein
MNTFIRDRRMAARHNHRTYLCFRIRNSSIPEEHTETENLSTHGVLFATKSPMSVGAGIDLRLEMPEQVTGKATTQWHCMGHVVRVVQPSRPEQNLGVAVAFDFYEPSPSWKFEGKGAP